MLYNMFPCVFDLKVGIKRKNIEFSGDIHGKETPGLYLYFVEGVEGQSACRAELTSYGIENMEPAIFGWAKKHKYGVLETQEAGEFSALVEPVLEALRLDDMPFVGSVFGAKEEILDVLKESEQTGDFFMSVHGRLKSGLNFYAAIDADRFGKRSFMWKPVWSPSFCVSAENILYRQKIFSNDFVKEIKKIEKPDLLLFNSFVRILQAHVLDHTIDREKEFVTR